MEVPKATKMKWKFLVPLALIFFSTKSSIVTAGANSALMGSLDNLKTAIANKMDLDGANCKRGRRDSCQDFLLDGVELNTVNSEIALRKLAGTVRSSGETAELIDDALDKLGDVSSAVSDIEDKLNE